MLRAKIYINQNELCDIQIVNQKIKNAKGETKYSLTVNDQLFDDEHYSYIYHDRVESWRKLLIKALTEIEEGTLAKIVESVIKRNIGAYNELGRL